MSCTTGRVFQLSQGSKQCRIKQRSGVFVSCNSSKGESGSVCRRQYLFGVAGISLVTGTRPSHAESFLKSSGGQGPLAEEESRLVQLRIEKEGEVRDEIMRERQKFESEAKQSQGARLCATPFGIDVVGITEFVALVGAVVGGVSARVRKRELQRLNDQLRLINRQLRQEARAGVMYAPSLNYTPPANVAGQQVSSDKRSSLYESYDDDDISTDRSQCREALKEGKKLLKSQQGPAAMVRFEKALMLSRGLEDKVLERRAVRGLAAAAKMQGQFRSALKHLERVLQLSKELNEYTGDADAYGSMADIYAELNDFEKAAVYYDKYIFRMTDGSVV
eukprot:TRINITY_DN846_c1_g1_i1.p1 TRINITY_DN846_c1_g1~~TRINITY_DN846_c1_g1_i1.p1  ORF type:complete len:334 (+),score=56.08 TRINITY_DN846_c1_g1_i1:1441-2442(+)